MRATFFHTGPPLPVGGGQLSLGIWQRRARGQRRRVYLGCLGIA